MTKPVIRLLLVDDNENDFILTRRLLMQSKTVTFTLDWIQSHRAGLEAILKERHDAYLIDYRLDGATGIDLLHAAVRKGCKAPIVILTGQGDANVDREAMRAGAADYLIKDKGDAEVLERVICHALERQQAQLALAQERQRLQTLIDNVPDSVFFKDAASRFVINNATHLRVLGADCQEEVRGKSDFDFFPQELASKYYADEQHIVRSAQPMINTEEQVLDPRQGPRWLLTSKVPLKGTEGGVVGIVGISRDITLLKEAEEALRQARDELEERVRERTAELSRAVGRLEQEIAERKRAEEKLRETEERYRLFFEQAPDSIVLCDAQSGALIEFNDRACATLGYTRAEMTGLKIADFDAVESPGETAAHLAAIVANSGAVFETKHRAKTGEVRDILISARPMTIRGRLYIHSLWMDITERKRVEAELRDAIVRLQKHDQEKSEFVSNVSHELKTPLTSMLYGTRNLLKGVAGQLSPDAVRYLKMFDKECQRLVNTINTILDLGRIDSQKFALSTVRVSLARLVARSVEALRIQAESNQVAVLLSTDRQTAFVTCDPEMMERVVQNIVSNAIKFTPAGGAVEIRVAADRVNRKHMTLEVEDNGVGIPPDALSRITERYFRVGRHPNGSGLGLAISKETVVLHGGTLAVESPPPGKSQGTRVTVALPVAEPPTVLIVDDEPMVLDLLRTQLDGHGYRVSTASSGSEARQMIETRMPDALILDLVLKDVHGCDLIVALKGSEQGRVLPILAVTGANVDESRLEVLTRFAIPLLPKPWHEAELLDRFESALMGMRVFQKPTSVVAGGTA
jgi:PAS domain S-box-containing protein